MRIVAPRRAAARTLKSVARSCCSATSTPSRCPHHASRSVRPAPRGAPHAQEVPSADGARLRKFWARRALASVVVHAALLYARLAYALAPARLAVVAALSEPLAVTTLAQSEQSLATLSSRLAALKAAPRPSLARALASAAQMLTSNAEATPSPKRPRVECTWRRGRVVVVAPLSSTSQPSAWQQWPEHGQFIDLAHTLSESLMRAGAAVHLDEVELVLVCLVPPESDYIASEVYQLTPQLTVRTVFSSGEDLDSTLVLLAAEQWNLQTVYVTKKKKAATLLCSSLQPSPPNEIRIRLEDSALSNLPTVLPSTHARRLLAPQPQDDEGGIVATLMAHTTPIVAALEDGKRVALHMHGGALYLHTLLPSDLPVLDPDTYTRDAHELHDVCAFASLVREATFRYSDASEAELSRTTLPNNPDLQTGVYVEKATRGLFVEPLNVHSESAEAYVAATRTLVAPLSLSKRRYERTLEYVHALAALVRAGGNEQNALAERWREIERVCLQHAASSKRHERVVRVMHSLLPALASAPPSTAVPREPQKARKESSRLASDADRYRYYAQHVYDAPGTRDETGACTRRNSVCSHTT